MTPREAILDNFTVVGYSNADCCAGGVYLLLDSPAGYYTMGLIQTK